MMTPARVPSRIQPLIIIASTSLPQLLECSPNFPYLVHHNSYDTQLNQCIFYNLHWLQRYLLYHEHALIIGQDHDALLLILIMGGFKCCCCYKLIKEVSTNTEYLMKIIIFGLKERNVSFINIDEYPLELIPLDSDVLSLEMDSSFKV